MWRTGTQHTTLNVRDDSPSEGYKTYVVIKLVQRQTRPCNDVVRVDAKVNLMPS